jgi:DNA helicase II / ATP-dependent DNA helicase PcrA
VTQRSRAPDTAADIELRRLLDTEPRRGLILVAGAGSGKTTSLVKALAHVISTRGDELRGRTQQVACITYTEVAVNEIQDDVGNSDLVHVSTIHSFLWQVVKPFQKDIASWVEANLRAKLAEEETKRASPSPGMRSRTSEKSAEKVKRYRRQLEELPKITRYTYGIGSDYGHGILGHSDILSMVPDLIMDRPLLARLVAAQFPFIFVDESQDTFKSVVESLKYVERLSRGKVCLGFFGDPMQQIYQTGVGQISAEPGWAILKKPENFRSAEKQGVGVLNIRDRAG